MSYNKKKHSPKARLDPYRFCFYKWKHTHSIRMYSMRLKTFHLNLIIKSNDEKKKNECNSVFIYKNTNGDNIYENNNEI